MKILNWLDQHFEQIILAFFLVVMACVMMFQIIMRYCFKNPLAWPEEIARYCLVGMTFFSLGYCTKYDQLLKLENFVKLFPQPIKKAVIILGKVVTIILFTYMGIKCIPLLQQALSLGQKSAGAEIPMALIYGMMPVGFFLGTLRGIQDLIVNEFIPKKEKEADR